MQNRLFRLFHRLLIFRRFSSPRVPINIFGFLSENATADLITRVENDLGLHLLQCWSDSTALRSTSSQNRIYLNQALVTWLPENQVDESVEGLFAIAPSVRLTNTTTKANEVDSDDDLEENEMSAGFNHFQSTQHLLPVAGPSVLVAHTTFGSVLTVWEALKQSRRYCKQRAPICPYIEEVNASRHRALVALAVVSPRRTVHYLTGQLMQSGLAVNQLSVVIAALTDAACCLGPKFTPVAGDFFFPTPSCWRPA
ncbi:hypothetical protein ECG_07851 [Echinococcus granulosus]|nr:hypothetical protein ECG_07851 [Echinococcus granulosus]